MKDSINLMCDDRNMETCNVKSGQLMTFISGNITSLLSTQQILDDIKEGLNNVRFNAHQNHPVGQGKSLCCGLIFLMFTHLLFNVVI